VAPATTTRGTVRLESPLEKPRIYGSEAGFRSAVARSIRSGEDLLAQTEGARNRMSLAGSREAALVIEQEWERDFRRWFNRTGKALAQYLQEQLVGVPNAASRPVSPAGSEQRRPDRSWGRMARRQDARGNHQNETQGRSGTPAQRTLLAAEVLPEPVDKGGYLVRAAVWRIGQGVDLHPRSFGRNSWVPRKHVQVEVRHTEADHRDVHSIHALDPQRSRDRSSGSRDRLRFALAQVAEVVDV
jgi:hypothetical protein